MIQKGSEICGEPHVSARKIRLPSQTRRNPSDDTVHGAEGGNRGSRLATITYNQVHLVQEITRL